MNINKKELEQMPLNLILSLNKIKENQTTYSPPLGERKGDIKYNSKFHQNENKLCFGGFYKSITRKIVS